jgi:DNA-binding NtrC family response regulator
MQKILVVDDIKRDREMLAGPFSSHEVRFATNLDDAAKTLKGFWPDVALVDAIFPKDRYTSPTFEVGSFLDLIDTQSRSSGGRPSIIVVSGQNEAAKRFDELRIWLEDGRVADVIPKSTADMGVEFFRAVLRLHVDNVLQQRKWLHVQRSAESAQDWFRRLGIITRSPKMLALRPHLEAAANSDLCVLLTGQTGSGKQLFAEAIHKLTGPDKPFIHVNCATIPRELFASEVFGMEGPPSGVTYHPKAGLAGAARDGVFFLDDIQRLALDHQNQLNMFLQERKFLRVGGTSQVPFPGRIVCTTNRDLEVMVKEGAFMEDLFYRVNGFGIQIPPLAERPEDIPGLADSFLGRFIAGRRAVNPAFAELRLLPESYDLLCAYGWRGNVRELKSLIEKAAAYAAVEKADEIGPELLARMEPRLGPSVSQGCSFDPLLSAAGVPAARWADLTEADAIREIRSRLEATAQKEFEAMLLALAPKARDAAPGTLGRPSQDPATIHCLKILLCLLLRGDHDINIQEIQEVLHVSAWATGKKVLEVLSGKIEDSSPSFAPFVKLPGPGQRKKASLVV